LSRCDNPAAFAAPKLASALINSSTAWRPCGLSASCFAAQARAAAEYSHDTARIAKVFSAAAALSSQRDEFYHAKKLLNTGIKWDMTDSTLHCVRGFDC